MKRNGILILMAITLVMSACKKKGCTDPTALNYSSKAKKDDGTCKYAQTPTINAKTLDCQEFNNPGTTYQLVDLGLEIDYIVDCKMPITCDLTIMPGVGIAFETDAGLRVNNTGSISAIGSTNAPIIFTGIDKSKGAWAGIFVDSDDTKNEFEHCKIEYAGGDDFNSNGDKGSFILYAGSTAKINNTNISNCLEYGINANYGGGSFTFSNNTITSCSKPMFIAAEYGSSISGGTFTGNTTDVIFIDTYAGDGDVKTSQTWSNLNVPYRVKGGSTVQSKADWTIAPGVVMEFEPSSGILVNDGKSLKAVGTPSEKIIFRGVNSGAGAWEHIYFNGTNLLNEIGFAEISDGGEDPTNTKGSVFVYYNAKLNIHDVSFNNNAACGVYGKLLSSQTANPNYSSSNLTFTNTPCTENFEN
jgi:hypothetical protein